MNKGREPRIVRLPVGLLSRRCAPLTTWIWVTLERGGGHYTAYAELTPERRKEWDAAEELLMRLSSGKHLYVSGTFEKAPDELQTWDYKEDRHSWLGMCKVTARERLHGILVGNPLERYGFLVCTRELNSQEAQRVATIHQEREDMDRGLIVEMCPAAYCGIEDGEDRDCLRFVFRPSDEEEILSQIKKLLRDFALE